MELGAKREDQITLNSSRESTKILLSYLSNFSCENVNSFRRCRALAHKLHQHRRWQEAPAGTSSDFQHDKFCVPLIKRLATKGQPAWFGGEKNPETTRSWSSQFNLKAKVR